MLQASACQVYTTEERGTAVSGLKWQLRFVAAATHDPTIILIRTHWSSHREKRLAVYEVIAYSALSTRTILIYSSRFGLTRKERQRRTWYVLTAYEYVPVYARGNRKLQ